MNKKLFALLLVIPLMVFITDQALGNTGPEGGKDKKEVQQQEAQAGGGKSTMSLKERLKDKEIRRDLKTAFTELRDTEWEGPLSESYKYSWEVKEQSTLDFLEDELIAKVEQMDPVDVSVNSFSRCPSGYLYTVEKESKGQFTRGRLIHEDGCESEVLANFRFDTSKQILEMELPLGLGYVSLEEYFDIRERFV